MPCRRKMTREMNETIDDVTIQRRMLVQREANLHMSTRAVFAFNRSSNLRATRTSNKKAELAYRKDDRAMRPMYGCPEKFRESLTTPTATFPEIFNGLLFRLSL